MTYTTKEVSTKLGINKDTLRYYEREGLIPPIEKDKAGHRIYSDSDIEWLFLIRCLRDTDMPISKIKQYLSLLIEQGTNSVKERRDILIEHEKYIFEKMEFYQNMLVLMKKKLEFYDSILSDDNEGIQCMDYKSEWELFRESLGGINHE